MSDPSYPHYPGPAEPMGPTQPAPTLPVSRLHPVRGLGIAAACLAGAFALIQVIEAVLAWHAQAKILDALHSDSDLDFWTPYDFVPLPHYAVGIAAYVVTCLWLYQARGNVELVRAGAHHARRKGWVWAGWVVPVVNLWFPYQVVRDVATDPYQPSRSSSLLGWWWTLWLASIIFERIGTRVLNAQIRQDPEAFSGLGPVVTVTALLCLGALVLWLRIIWRITTDQAEFTEPRPA